MNKVERFPKARAERQRSRVPTLGQIGLQHFAPYLMNRIMARWNADLAADFREHGLTIQMRTLAVLSVTGRHRQRSLASILSPSSRP